MFPNSFSEPCIRRILPMSGVCGEHDTVWLSGCWFELHKPRGRMLRKVIWLLDYGYCTGSSFYLFICGLSLMLMARIVAASSSLFHVPLLANQRRLCTDACTADVHARLAGVLVLVVALCALPSDPSKHTASPASTQRRGV